MQTQYGTAAEAAILAKTRKFQAKILVDWNNNGLYDHGLSDISRYVDDVTTDIQLAGSAPAEILLIEGSGSGQLTFTMAGNYSGSSLAKIFSPYNSESPLADLPQVGSEIRYSIIAEGKNGTYEFPQFVGNIRTISPDRKTGEVKVTALDRVEKLRKSIQLPAWAISSKQIGWGQTDQMLCRSHWVIDHALRLCDAGQGPKRPTFHHELSGVPSASEGPQLFASLNGSEIATVGRSMNAGSNSYPTGTAMYVDTGPFHPSAPAGTLRPQGVVGVGLPLGQAATDPGDRGILRWFAEDIDGINPYATHYFGFTINANGSNPQLYQTISSHEVLEVRAGAKMMFVIDINAGQVRIRFVNLNTNSTQTGPWVDIPSTGFNIDVFAMWDLTDETGSRCYMSAGANNSGWVSMGSAPGPGSLDDNAGRITLGHALSLSDVFYSNRNYYAAGVNPDEAYRAVKYPAVLDRGRNRFTHVPNPKPQEAWKLITDVAGAEMGSVFWDENGIFRFWNFDTVESKKNFVVREFDLDQIEGLTLTNSLDSVRNEYTVVASKRRAAGLIPVYKSNDVDEFYVPGSTTKTFRLWVDDVIAPWTLVMGKHSSDPLSGGTYPWPKWDDDAVIHGYCLQYLINDLWQEVNSRAGVTILPYFTREGYLTIRISNGWPEPIRLARGAGSSSTASFILGGTKMEGDADQTVWTRDNDSIAVYGNRSLELKGDWYQDSIEGLNLIRDLLTRTSNPIPATDAITIAGDPRLQLGDTVSINDPKGFGQDIRLQILGISRSFSSKSGLTDTLTVEMVQPTGPIFNPDPDEEDTSLRTNLQIDPMAADDTSGIGPGPVGSDYVTGLTDMIRTTGYHLADATTNAPWPAARVFSGKTYRASVYVRPDGAGGGTSGGAPGTQYDLTPWYLGTATDEDSSGTSDSIEHPELDSYTTDLFKLDELGRMVMIAPVQGATTSGSGGTRTEFREQDSGVNSDWAMSSADRQLTVTGVYDPTSITDRQEMIVGQIHGSTGTPPLYLAIDFEASSPRLRLFKNGPGLANIFTGITADTKITWRIKVQSGRVKFWAVKGEVSDLPSTPLYDWPASDFTDNANCYMKFGAYNKSEVVDGGNGEAISYISYYELIQDGVSYTGQAGGTSGGSANGTAHIEWYQSNDTLIAATPANPWTADAGQVIRVDTLAHVAPQNAAK